MSQKLTTTQNKMRYNTLGNKTGLLVSELSYGTWVNFGNSKSGFTDEDVRKLYDIMKVAYEYGCNTFDTAEGYENGDAELMLGKAIQLGYDEKVWDRADLVIITKIYFGALRPYGNPKGDQYRKTVNKLGLSRKHLVEGIRESLKRMNLEYCDVVLAHRPDPVTPIEEIVVCSIFMLKSISIF